MNIHDDFAEMAQEMIAEDGRNVLLRSYASTGDKFNPVRTSSDVTIKAVQSYFKANQIDGKLIQQNDVLFLVAAKTATINKQQKIIDDGLEYSIIDFKLVKPGSLGILYKLQCRI